MSNDMSQKTPRAQQRRDRQGSSTGRWRKRVLLAIGLVAVGTSAATLIPGTGSSRENGPKLTHTITRGDLIVTVTEQGTLESSANTEIKCKVRGAEIPIIWVIASGTEVKPGDELIRLETLVFEDRVAEVTKWAHMTRSAAERSKADVARAELALSEYLEGRYRTELMTLEKDLAVAESNLRTSHNMLDHAEMMAGRGYIGELEVEEDMFAVTQAQLQVGVKKTEIEVLKNFTKAMALETLKGNWNASQARHEADKERAKSLAAQLELCWADLEYCVVKAEKGGSVIYPAAARWKDAPEIQEGATVYMGQTMLLMPDLSQMQVKVGIRESIVDRIKPGLAARITLPDRTLDGEVSSVASVTGPAGWWTGNLARYDTIIKLPSVPGLKPGMSAEAEVILARHEDVLLIPVAAVVETAQGAFCWVKTTAGAKRRSLKLGDTNNVFTVVEAGLEEGDEIVLHPFAFEEAQTLAIKPLDKAMRQEAESTKPSGSLEAGTKSQSPGNSNKQESKPQGVKPKQGDSQSKAI